MDYERKVQEPEEIPELVEEAHIRGEDGLTRLFLDHEEEKNVVRGRREVMTGPKFPENRRRDGGLSWYHDDTKCAMVAAPNDGSKAGKGYMEAWSAAIIEELEDLGHEAYMSGGDVYSRETGEQLVGLSASLRKDSVVLRACWYEEEPEIDGMLEEDGIEPEEFYDAVDTVEGLYDRLTDRIDPSGAGPGFISEEAREMTDDYLAGEGVVKGSCVLGEDGKYF